MKNKKPIHLLVRFSDNLYDAGDTWIEMIPGREYANQ